MPFGRYAAGRISTHTYQTRKMSAVSRRDGKGWDGRAEVGDACCVLHKPLCSVRQDRFESSTTGSKEQRRAASITSG